MLGIVFSFLFAFAGKNNWAHVQLDAARYTFLVGIVGIHLYLRRSERFGLLGTVGFSICVFVFGFFAILDLGIILNEGVERLYLTLGPVLVPPLPLGLLLVGVAILRAGRLPRGGSWLLIATALSNVMGIVAMIISGGTLGDWMVILPTVLFWLGWGRLGYRVSSQSRATAEESVRGR